MDAKFVFKGVGIAYGYSTWLAHTSPWL
jgi:hypothetical protein